MYTIEQAERVASELERFTTGYAHHVAGHFANLEFWLSEAAHALEVLRDYPSRFKTLCEAQAEWVEAHDTQVYEGGYCRICGGVCEFDEKRTPLRPTRAPSSERDAATRRLKDAVYFFVLRCYRMRLLDEAGVRAACDRVSTSVDPGDLKQAH